MVAPRAPALDDLEPVVDGLEEAQRRHHRRAEAEGVSHVRQLPALRAAWLIEHPKLFPESYHKSAHHQHI